MAIILYFAKVVKRFNGGFIKNFKNFKKYFFGGRVAAFLKRKNGRRKTVLT
jgi:hypothetical protein